MANERRVIVFRHGKQVDMGRGYTCWSPDAVLSMDGVQQMRQMAEKHRQILMEVVVFACSPLIRAQQSLHTMMIHLGYEGLPKLMDKIHLLPGLKYQNPEVWCSDNPNDTVSDLWRKNPEAIESEGEQVFDGICRVADELQDGQSALCISHGGPLDAALAFAKDVLGIENVTLALENTVDLKKGEGVVFIFEGGMADGGLLGIEELRNE